MRDERLEFDCEPLEDRRMLAGDVDVFVNSKGELIVQGDRQGNSVQINETGAPDTYIVYGLGTTFNGQAEFLASGVTNGIRVRLRGGNDGLSIVGTGGFRLSTNGLDISTGSGDDQFEIEQIIVNGDFTMRTGSGEDSVGLADVTVLSGRTQITTNGGNDVLNLRFFTALGSSESSLSTGSGADTVVLNNVFHNGPLDVKTGGGRDDLCLLDVDCFTSVSMNGGGARDILQGLNTVFTPSLVNRNFEQFADKN